MTTVNVKGTTPSPKKETTKIGSYFVNEDAELYVLARVDRGLCCLINTFGGNRWNDPTEIEIESGKNEISQEDFLKVCAGVKFTQVKSVDITFER